MDVRAFVMGLAFAFIWSSAFTSARVIVLYAPPLWALSVRFLVAGLIACGIAVALGQSMRLTAAQWRAVVLFGICQNALYLGLNFIALQRIEASVAAIIASTMPLLVALAGWVIFHEKLRRMAIAGLFAGVVGVALIMGLRINSGGDVIGTVMCGVAVVSLTVATLAMRGVSTGNNLLMIVGLQMLVGAAVLVGPALALEPFEVTWTWQLVVAFAYSTLVSGVLATYIWFVLVRRLGAVKAATYHFLNPFFGVAVAAALLGERLGIFDFLGVAIIAGGILAVQWSKQLPTPM